MSRSTHSSVLHADGAMDVMKTLGERSDLLGVIFTGYNPCVEDYQSGNYLALLIYYLSLHYAISHIEH